jgi:DNA-binding NarL/FixJ family response regulator
MSANRVVIADDHQLFRDGIVEICGSEPDLEVVGQAGNGDEAIAVVRRTRPDVVLLDVQMPGPDVMDVLRELLECRPVPQVAILTVHDDPRLVGRLMAVGARAYISKGVTRQELMTAIRSIRKDRERVVLSISRDTMKRLQGNANGPLTAREIEVLTLVASGLQNSQIAARLYISEGTVKRHLTNIYLKLEVRSRIKAVNKATAMGLLTRDI